MEKSYMASEFQAAWIQSLLPLQHGLRSGQAPLFQPQTILYEGFPSCGLGCQPLQQLHALVDGLHGPAPVRGNEGRPHAADPCALS